jgi:uncharacterized protein YecT (DUF1311 family)
MKFVLALLAVLFATAATAKPVTFYKAADCDNDTALPDLLSCTGGNFDAAEKALNAIYPKVMAALPDNAARDALRKSERAWLKGRDKKCADENPDSPDGAEYPVELNGCLEQKDAARIQFLANMKECQANAACKPR